MRRVTEPELSNRLRSWGVFLSSLAGFVSEDNVYRVCDQPHPLKVRGIVEAAARYDPEAAIKGVAELWQQGEQWTVTSCSSSRWCRDLR